MLLPGTVAAREDELPPVLAGPANVANAGSVPSKRVGRVLAIALTPDGPEYCSLLTTDVGPEWETRAGSSYDAASEELEDGTTMTSGSPTSKGAAAAARFLRG